MPLIALAAALGASLCWAVGSLIAHRPATQLGAFEFTRTQLISSFALLIAIVTAFNGWQSVSWVHWPSFVAASLIGVVFTNLAMIACLRRGGPRRMQLLVSMSAPFAALLGLLFLGESMSPRKFIGVGLAFSGFSQSCSVGVTNTASRQFRALLPSSLHSGSSLQSAMLSGLLP
jgi:drug/metabolite transporter (DMT)-like permease